LIAGAVDGYDAEFVIIGIPVRDFGFGGRSEIPGKVKVVDELLGFAVTGAHTD
jgi:hypothetical protein